MDNHDTSRRDFLKKTAYIAPAILLMKVTPSFARNGSYKMGYKHKDHDYETNGRVYGNGRKYGHYKWDKYKNDD